MSAIPEQILNGHKISLNNLLAAQGAMFTGFEKLIDLNLKVIKASLDEATEKTQQAIELKDPQEALAFTSALAQPTAEKALAYSKHVYDILNGVQVDLAKLAEDQIARNQQQVSEVLDEYAKNAPTGSEGAIALVKTSVATAQNAYDTAVKAARQAADAAESNIAAAAKVASDAAAAASKAAPRAARRTTA
ncbi:TIGR01841 family phasin [Pusillimonas sp. TS35]|uniref:phasin family protein n=1 Tax=Paracandidimonas lactea TaxID=2895524 RepID=UPI00136B6221|nr:phasin family protein [Paracandidimonas lactea]MYN14536.1 TIGR01841 family phasin [Pusillimonas sp. TS35]